MIPNRGAQLPLIGVEDATRTSEGIEQEIAADPFTGRANLTIPIPVTPCREAQPALSLDYDSTLSNGIFGLGFRLSLSSIFRSTRHGVPAYSSDDVFTSSAAGDLVRTSDPLRFEDIWSISTYIPRTDNTFDLFELWKHPDGTSYWRILGPEGDIS